MFVRRLLQRLTPDRPSVWGKPDVWERRIYGLLQRPGSCDQGAQALTRVTEVYPSLVLGAVCLTDDDDDDGSHVEQIVRHP